MQASALENDTPHYAAIRDRLWSRNPHLWREAEDMIKLLGEEGVSILLRLVQEEKRRARRRRLLGAALLIIEAPILIAIRTYLKARFGGAQGEFLSWGLLIFLLFCPLVALGLPSQRFSRLTALLENSDDKRLLGVYCETLFSETTVSVSVLMRLLPQIKASDAPLLHPRQRRTLYRFLQARSFRIEQRTFLLTALKALEQIGDRQAIPYVQRIAKHARYAEVRAAAEACLPYLEAIAERQTEGQGLLRPMEGEIEPERLLRPATERPDTPPEQLVRSAAPPTEHPSLKEDMT